METYIYALCHPQTEKIRYVGKSNDPQSRLRGHVHDSAHKDYPVHRWIRKLQQNQLRPMLKILEKVSERKWKSRERYWINYYASLYDDLLNIAPGGEGPADHRKNQRGEQRYNAKLTSSLVEEMRNEREHGATIPALAQKYGIHFSTAQRICSGASWSHIGGSILNVRRPSHRSGISHPMAKLDNEKVKRIRADYANGKLNQSELARKYNVTQANIWMIVNNKSWTIL